MIISSEPLIASRGCGETCDHVFRGSGNESIDEIQGSEFDVMQTFDEARDNHDKYAVCHFKINPKRNITHEQMLQSVSMLAVEFGFDPDTCTIVRHRKAKAGEPDADEHYHLYASWRNSAGKCLDSSYMRVRQEKISRTCEVLFGHDIVKGRHQVAVICQLRDEGKADIADYIEAHTPDLYEPVQSAFTAIQHQSALRQGGNLGKLRQSIRDLRITSETFSEMVEGLSALGVSIQKGEKANTYIIVNNENNKFLGSANRLFEMTKGEFANLFEALQQGKDTTFALSEGESPVNASEMTGEKILSPMPQVIPESTLLSSVPKLTTKGIPSGSGVSDIKADHFAMTDSMSREQKASIAFQNEEANRKASVEKETLANQQKFADDLLQMMSDFDKKWKHVLKEPFSDPNSRNPVLIREKHESILKPLRTRYHVERQKWFNGSSTRKALQEFNNALKKLRYDRDDFKALDILNNESDFLYCLNWMADFYVAGRERKLREWQTDNSVKSYLKAKKDFDELYGYIQKTGDVELLRNALRNPVYAFQQMRKTKDIEATMTAMNQSRDKAISIEKKKNMNNDIIPVYT
ncbi:hypothetical protein ATPR_2644 [Acetobacter tropicalis NBRC 101654]|uniref:Uncharacterized protein n=1 Tax=Acetobacter tropicalis NBRC 101654 TaxID=749388 RepID=F7VGZ5_9PROT|nr:hypothetical protein [Acetobacter tropicalis]GAA09640.1 hypothetical protein ATPR_2644 [Acetobacter tropicalis NBRC 101654]